MPCNLVWTAFVLPSFHRSQVSTRVLGKSYRDRAYKILNFTYQVGVFVSRSSGLLFPASNVATPWMMPILQCGLWIFFYAIAIQHFMYGYITSSRIRDRSLGWCCLCQRIYVD